jgi:F420-dependent oxidoreductase-like protein
MMRENPPEEGALVRIGINGSGLLARPSIDAVVEHARQAARDGFPSYWLAQGGAAEALTLLALAAREAPGIEFGTAVVPTYPRHPAVLAGQAMTTQAATGGRLVLGIGLSHKPVIEGSYGLSFDKPIRHMREYLSILVPLIEEGKVSFAGETLTGRGEVSIPSTDPCPILVAALGPQMLRLAGSRTAGTILWMVGPKTIREHIVPRISEAAAKAGREAPRVVAGLPICVTDDVERTRERAGRAFAIYGQLPSYRAMLDREGAETPNDVCVFGGASEVRDQLMAIAEAGATDFAAVEFCKTQDEMAATRELLRSLL